MNEKRLDMILRAFDRIDSHCSECPIGERLCNQMKKETCFETLEEWVKSENSDTNFEEEDGEC